MSLVSFSFDNNGLYSYYRVMEIILKMSSKLCNAYYTEHTIMYCF